MVLGRDGQIGSPDPAAAQSEAVECLGAGHLVDEVKVDVEQIGLAGCGVHHVAIPNLLGEGSPGHRYGSLSGDGEFVNERIPSVRTVAYLPYPASSGLNQTCGARGSPDLGRTS